MHEYGTFKERPVISLEGICFFIPVDSDSTVYLQLRIFTHFRKKNRVFNSTVGHYMVFNGTHDILYLSLW